MLNLLQVQRASSFVIAKQNCLPLRGRLLRLRLQGGLLGMAFERLAPGLHFQLGLRWPVRKLGCYRAGNIAFYCCRTTAGRAQDALP